MKNQMPFELKAIKFEPGFDHVKITASLYLNGKKIGELLDDGWCDELYIEFKNMKQQEHFIEEFKKYIKGKKVKFKEPELFFRNLIEKNSPLKKDSKKIKGSL